MSEPDRTPDPCPTPDLIQLVEVRNVIVSEPAAGDAWQESLIKQLTAGAPVEVNELHEGFIEFRPDFRHRFSICALTQGAPILVGKGRFTAVSALFRRVRRQMRSALRRICGRALTTSESGTALSGDPAAQARPCCREGEGL